MKGQPALPDGPLVAWYGDDFTGSAAVMEVMSFSGYPSILFFDVPTPAQLAKASGYRGVGVAGVSRSKGVDWMDAHLPNIFSFLRQVGAPLIHYKVCSTLDSSPTVGSIGRAADIALGDDDWAPIVMGAPAIGRYQAFGNLFAKAGDDVFRLDRHPTMSVHPVTPMDEADVIRHLQKQTAKDIGLIDLRDIKNRNIDARIAAEVAIGRRLIAFDIIDEETLGGVGETLWRQAANGLVAIGSQGLEYALVAAWNAAGDSSQPRHPEKMGRVDQVAVVSGSCSPVTEEQINYAEQAGFIVIPIDASQMLDPEIWKRECDRVIEAAMEALNNGESLIICSARGPHDPAISKLRKAVARSQVSMEEINERLGTGLGALLNRILGLSKLKRAAIAGGDTSSYGAQQLGLYGVTARYPLSPGAAVLVGHSEDPKIDGLEISLKGGQMGERDYFVKLRDGQSY